MFHVASNRYMLWAGFAISVDTRAIFHVAAKARRQLNKALFGNYRPELHYMRGPGPKWREKHGELQTARSSAVLPEAVVIAEENDLLRDEGECFREEIVSCERMRHIMLGQSTTSAR